MMEFIRDAMHSLSCAVFLLTVGCMVRRLASTSVPGSSLLVPIWSFHCYWPGSGLHCSS